jgi:tripartite ATP-independent transporter DctP family solute receptor
MRARAAIYVIYSCCTIASIGLNVTGAALAREFRAADTQPENYPTVQALDYMGRLVAERSNGRHTIRVFHSRQLGEEKDTIEQTRVGAIDLNRVNIAPLTSFVPETNVLGLPFLFRSIEHLHNVLDGPIGDRILASFDAYGFVGLTFYDSGARSLYNSRGPVTTPADLKGLRIRVQESDLMMRMIRALGGEPIPLPYGQVMTALVAKLIDGAENNWPSYVTTNHYTVARYYTVTEHTMSPEVLIMSRKIWDTLSPEDQTIIRESARESSRFMRDQWMLWEERSRKQARESGTVITVVDKKPFEAAMAPVYESVLSEPKLRQLVEQIREVQ